MNLLICFGTRPEAIKMAPVIHELKKRNIPFNVCVTAQHREMLDQVLDFFDITPDFDLDLMKSAQTLNGLCAAIFSKIDEVFDKVQPDIVLVHGDTTTASVITQAAFHRQIKVGHVEAGLRTYNKMSPFPEEINRQIIGKIADFHFAPTLKAKGNLMKEQISEENILVTGNSVVDALQWAGKKMENLSLSKEVEALKLRFNPEKKLILVTGHRRENFGKGLEEICEALLEIALNKDVEIVYPVHLNPNVVSTVEKMLSQQTNIHLISPVAYPTMLWLMKRSSLIISDSGGIQEEAPTIGKPVLVTRMISERMEGVEAGCAVISGTSKTVIVAEVNSFLKDPPDFTGKENPYGDGRAAGRIVDFLIAQGHS
ncbi:UDP-N-acetylglucosamine 2-epimerase (non-hydrolyzing) [Antarcticibacterium arcticum]|uniref:UDP-N-acetylglucosamine 2-epimerase (non-hydrolyzing) n=1 Tax=Antarcticibacterium arcticum TaxID=2585771 RepID=A0A5B8YNC7_9FLAO|nr:UDP-N-acetylglucosamine 2-epimerase (non-hydrolyzing) [Antarcticibacterium arcticum]QED37756.1 UDP-N-acetylglucosamine 2-epimerase (non-hydrolyzing) [Antarcticibacterium arcticum]